MPFGGIQADWFELFFSVLKTTRSSVFPISSPLSFLLAKHEPLNFPSPTFSLHGILISVEERRGTRRHLYVESF